MEEIESDSVDIAEKELAIDLDEVGRRIRTARCRYNLSQSEFAAGLHISRKWLSEMENGKKCPSGLLLLGLESRYAINKDWILGGNGSMLVCSDFEEECAESVMLIKSFSRLSREGREKLLNILNAFLFIEENKDRPPHLDS